MAATRQLDQRVDRPGNSPKSLLRSADDVVVAPSTSHWQARWRRRLIACGTALVLLEMASMFVTVSWSSARCRKTWQLGSGMFQYRADPYGPPGNPRWPSGFSIHLEPGAALWARSWGFTGRTFYIEEWPLWIPAVPSLLVGFLLRPASAAMHGRCRACGYDLTGNSARVCPGCGHITADTRPTRSWVRERLGPQIP
jgi:hypothetical protein